MDTENKSEKDNFFFGTKEIERHRMEMRKKMKFED